MGGGNNKKGASPKALPKLVLIFGENENDTKAVAAFLTAVLPTGKVKVEARKRPPVLIRDASKEKIPSRVSVVEKLIAAASVNHNVVAVFLHEDCDATEPAHTALEEKIRTAFAGGSYLVEAAVPAWETETWLMQWPDAFPKHVQSWRSVKSYEGRRVGLIENAKEHLTRALRPTTGTRDYRESDAPIIAGIVAAEGWVQSPRAQSDSYSAFLTGARRVADAI